MYAAFRQPLMRQGRGAAALKLVSPSQPYSPPASELLPIGELVQDHGGYQPRQRWGVLIALLAAHVLLLVVLVKLDVIDIAAARKPVVMELIHIPQMAPPPPPEPAAPSPVADQVPVMPKIVAPAPLVESPVALPTSVAVTPKAVAAIAAPAAPSAGVAPPAPITPPDFSADYLNNPAPRYPYESRRRHEQGTVTLKVLVSPDGQVEKLKIDGSSGYRRLDSAAMDAVRRWKFAPAKQAGQPVAAWVIVPIPFVLKA